MPAIFIVWQEKIRGHGPLQQDLAGRAEQKFHKPKANQCQGKENHEEDHLALLQGFAAAFFNQPDQPVRYQVNDDGIEGKKNQVGHIQLLPRMDL